MVRGGGGGSGTERSDVARRAALPDPGALLGGDAEVPADFLDDVVDGAGFEVEFEGRIQEAFGEFGVEGFGVGYAGEVGALAVDGVFDAADEFLAGVGRVRALGGLRLVGGDVAGEGDGAADGPGDAVEGDGGIGFGVFGD